MVANRAFNQDSFNYPIWSVSVELWIYLLFFLSIRYIGSSFLINLLVVATCVWLEQHDIKNLLVECAKLFYAGGLAAIVRRRMSSKALIAVATTCAWGIAVLMTRWLWERLGAQPNEFMRTFSCTVVPIFLFCLSSMPPLPRFVERMIETLANLTYSSYLLHFPIQILIALVCVYQGWSIPLYEPWFFIGYIALVLITAHFTYLCFEVPTQRLLRRIKIVVSSA